MQPGSVLAGIEPPCGGQSIGQRRLLLQQLAGTVTDPARLDQDHQGVIAQEVGHQFLGLHQPGQPRLHPVELLTVGQSFPLMPAPRRGTDQRGRLFAHGLVGHQLAAAEDLHLFQIVDRPLVGHVETGQPVDLVAPQVDADRVVGRRREHIDDPAPHGQLATVLHDRLAPIAHGHQPGDQLIDRDPVPRTHLHRAGRRPPWTEALEHRLDGGDDDLRSGAIVGAVLVTTRASVGPRPPQLPQQPETPTHGGHVGAHPLERKGLPGGKHMDPLSSGGRWWRPSEPTSEPRSEPTGGA